MPWRVFLPVVGLIVFTGISFHSYRVSREGPSVSGRFFLWSTFRLDSDPLNRHSQFNCVPSKEACVGWDVVNVDSWLRPTTLERIFGISALPALIVGLLMTRGLGLIGINEIWSFMFSMPLLIFAWFYSVGSVIDGWRFKRSHRTSATVADKSD
jgi:hypothetical protein